MFLFHFGKQSMTSEVGEISFLFYCLTTVRLRKGGTRSRTGCRCQRLAGCLRDLKNMFWE